MREKAHPDLSFHRAHLTEWAVPRRYINAYFKELIDGIFLHGGDVIKFAGDALQVRVRTDGS